MRKVPEARGSRVPTGARAMRYQQKPSHLAVCGLKSTACPSRPRRSTSPANASCVFSSADLYRYGTRTRALSVLQIVAAQKAIEIASVLREGNCCRMMIGETTPRHVAGIARDQNSFEAPALSSAAKFKVCRTNL